jgi:hypothetical protein
VSRSIAKTDDRDRADNRQTREWLETFETLEADGRIRAALTPAGPAGGATVVPDDSFAGGRGRERRSRTADPEP